MSLTADQITIAITVYSRRQYIRQAVASALEQTVPVRVMVMEDCGPDPGLQGFVKEAFGGRVEYVRNSARRGLFGNWNACLENCRTSWLSILHDDDFLTPNFVESMLALSKRAPSASLFFGQTDVVDDDGKAHPTLFMPEMAEEWRWVRLEDTIWHTPFPYPGQLFRVEDAVSFGGFRATSQYCGDWEMWSNLVSRSGGARTRDLVAYQRQHAGEDRGTNVVVRSGRVLPLSYVQHKRVLHLLRKAGRPQPIDRREYQRRYAVSTKFLLRFGGGLSPRLLRYHWRLLLMSPAPHVAYWLFQWAARAGGPGLVRASSHVYRRMKGISQSSGSPAAALSGRRA